MAGLLGSYKKGDRLDSYRQGGGLLDMAIQNPEEAAKTLLGFTPIVGDAMSVYDGIEAAKKGDMLGAGLGALGALPFVPNMAGMFIGKGAKTWDAVQSAKALEMEKAGADARTIWKETGNWKGPDGKWRQEIPDNKAKVIKQNGQAEEYLSDRGVSTYPSTIEKVIDHPLLLNSYDDLRGSRVTMRNSVTGGEYTPRQASGSFVGEHFTLPMRHGQGDLLNHDSSKSTILHELQHGIQQREGWASGGDPGRMFGDMENPNALYRRLAGEAEARATQARMNLDAEQRRALFPLDSYDVPEDQLIFNGLLDGPAMSVSKEGPRAEAMRIAQANAAKPIEEGGLGLRPDNTPMERAKALGMEDVLHGSSSDIEQVTTEGRRYARPFYTTESNTPIDAEFASQFANTRSEIGDPKIYPLMINRSAVVDTRNGIPQALQDAADESYSALNIGEKGLPTWGEANNWATAAKNKGIKGVLLDERPNLNSISVLDPSIIRSRFAAFDPARRHEADLLGFADPRLLALIAAGTGGGLLAQD